MSPTVTIAVKDDKGRPVAYAAITIGGIAGNTDHAGTARINVPTSGPMQLNVRTAFHKPYSQKVTIPPLSLDVTLASARFGG